MDEDDYTDDDNSDCSTSDDDNSDCSTSDDDSDQSSHTNAEQEDGGNGPNLAAKAIRAATNLVAANNYGRAFAYYLLALQLQPQCKDTIRGDFILVCRKWCDQLEQLGKIDDMFKCYESARQALPDCEEIYNNIGAKLFQFGHRNLAVDYFRKALQINPQLVRATENLQNISNLLVERWHFCMLNDVTRNSSYRLAIDRAIANGRTTVLDIGSGTGILRYYSVDLCIAS